MTKSDDDPVCTVVSTTLIANAHHDAERESDQSKILGQLRAEHRKCSPTTCDIAYLLQLFELATKSHTSTKEVHDSLERQWAFDKQSLLHVIYRLSGAPTNEAPRSRGPIRCPSCFATIPSDSPHLKTGRCPICGGFFAPA